jgi:predicted transcriptional regulator of viral defense system
MNTKAAKARAIFYKNGGIMRSSEARREGIHPQTLSRMVETERLVKEERGLYRLAEIELSGNADLIQVAKLVPRGVVCLISALSFHGLTTQIPHKVYLAIPQAMKKPKLTYPPLDVVWLSSQVYSAGIESHELDGITVRIYNREKTIADCFKFRNKIGLDVAIEGLKEYLRLADRSIDVLMHYAAVDRVQKVMQPYLAALV